MFEGVTLVAGRGNSVCLKKRMASFIHKNTSLLLLLQLIYDLYTIQAWSDTMQVHRSSVNLKSISVIYYSLFYLFQYEGELAVREEFPEAIIMRPARFCDLNDKFIFYYTNPCKCSNLFCFNLYLGLMSTICFHLKW